MPTVTIFKNAVTTDDPHYLKSETLVKYIREGRWKKNIEMLNSLPVDSPEQKKYKKTAVPGIVWQGKFNYRNDKSITDHSGLVALDFDHLSPDELDVLRSMFIDDKYTHILFTSCRLSGLKLIIKIPPSIEDHKGYVGALMDYHKNSHYDHFDDVSRLCFVSYDPDIYYNPDSDIWVEKVSITPRKSIRGGNIVNGACVESFKKLSVWADKKYGYHDGNKHKHLVMLFAACNAYGIPKEETLGMAWEKYSSVEGVSHVEYKDFEQRAESIYKLYEGDFNTNTFESNGSVEVEDVQYIVDDTHKPVATHDTDPISMFNETGVDYVKQVLKDKKISDNKSDSVWVGNIFCVISDKCKPFKKGCSYTPYQIIILLRFKGKFIGAYHWVVTRCINDDQIPYLRVGTDYYKKITKVDRFGIDRTEIKLWKKAEIIQDEGKGILDKVPKFDDFALVPDNINYQPIINNCYNLYKAFLHKPIEGEWKWTEVLIRQMFGEQYELGLRYLQILYLYPEHMMPILVLTSRERQTGKSTFVNWLNMVFGDNMANISPDDLTNVFNSTYSAANIIAVEETLIDKTHTVEKLKALATGKFITVNPKWVTQYRTPFYGKFILTSNNEDKFARIEQEEIRFFIRKVPTPTVINHNIETDMIPEIPAFLHYLTTLPPVDFSKDRTGFTPKELDNDSLQIVKNESLSGLAKDLKLLIEELFLNELCTKNEFKADPGSIKERFFRNDKDIPRSYIIRTLQNDFNMKPSDAPIYFYPFEKDASKTGRAYTFRREDFTDEPIDETKIVNNNTPF